MMILATRSAGKLRELYPLFRARGIDVVDLHWAGISASAEEEHLEAFATFEENAIAKARYFHARSGLPTFADDSGLVVRALDDAPGVLSKRWSGRPDLVGQALDDENNRLLLERMRDCADRSAAYVCAAAFVDSERSLVCRGEASGRIVDQPRGADGFGYDPYFLSRDLNETFAAVSRDAKERVSHRGRAFRALLAMLDEDGSRIDELQRLGS